MDSRTLITIARMATCASATRLAYLAGSTPMQGAAQRSVPVTVARVVTATAQRAGQRCSRDDGQAVTHRAGMSVCSREAAGPASLCCDGQHVSDGRRAAHSSWNPDCCPEIQDSRRGIQSSIMPWSPGSGHRSRNPDARQWDLKRSVPRPHAIVSNCSHRGYDGGKGRCVAMARAARRQSRLVASCR